MLTVTDRERMKRIIPLLVCIVLGIGIGWYLGYTWPSAKRQRELLDQYHYERDNFHLTDQEMADAGPKIPQYFKDMKRRDETAAVFGLGGFVLLERGDTERAKRHLLKTVGSYYRVYHNNGGDTNFIAKIEEAARKYPDVAAEISREVK